MSHGGGLGKATPFDGTLMKNHFHLKRWSTHPKSEVLAPFFLQQPKLL
jgi:hypothetical protein